jgi:hypothetical protein
MNSHGQIHAIVNEVPAILIGVAALCMTLGWIGNSSQARLLAYIGFVVCGAWTIISIASGEAAMVSNGSTIYSQDLLTTHHRIATVATVAIEACLLLGIFTALTEKNEHIYRAAAPTLIALAVVAFLAILVVAGIGCRMMST